MTRPEDSSWEIGSERRVSHLAEAFAPATQIANASAFEITREDAGGIFPFTEPIRNEGTNGSGGDATLLAGAVA